MKRKYMLLAASVVLAAISGIASAESSFSANAALTTDYVWRGISQTDEDPAIQGGFDVESSNGFSAGMWASNVDFNSDANVEVDVYGGYSTTINDISLSVGAIYYMYPKESDLNFLELNAGIGYGPFSAMVSYTDEFGEGGPHATYFEVGGDFDLPFGGLGLGLHAGHYSFDGSTTDYNDWKVALSKEIGGFGLELAYTDTDLSKTECGGDICDGRAIFTISKSF